jgi:hypothetical protein
MLSILGVIVARVYKAQTPDDAAASIRRGLGLLDSFGISLECL